MWSCCERLLSSSSLLLLSHTVLIVAHIWFAHAFLSNKMAPAQDLLTDPTLLAGQSVPNTSKAVRGLRSRARPSCKQHVERCVCVQHIQLQVRRLLGFRRASECQQRTVCLGAVVRVVFVPPLFGSNPPTTLFWWEVVGLCLRGAQRSCFVCLHHLLIPLQDHAKAASGGAQHPDGASAV
jgi:hypothetical protein